MSERHLPPTRPRAGTLLDVRDLHVRYGKVEAVHGVSLQVDPGTIVSVIGPNGAGKTTLLGAIIGLLPAQGEIAYAGASVASLSVEQRVARGLILVPERRELFAAMCVADNLELGAFARARSGDRGWRKTLDEVYTAFRDSRSGAVSSPERSREASARCWRWAAR